MLLVYAASRELYHVYTLCEKAFTCVRTTNTRVRRIDYRRVRRKLDRNRWGVPPDSTSLPSNNSSSGLTSEGQ
jgi:hypothetical protein